MVLGDATGLDGPTLVSIWQDEPLPEFPSVRFAADPEYPDCTLPSDNLKNKYSLIVVSEKMKDFLVSREVSLIDCHPVDVRDHKKKKTRPYFMINPLKPIDCLDRKASGALVLSGSVAAVKKVVLRPGSVDPQRLLFRIEGYEKGLLVRSDLATAIEEEFSGIKFRSLDPKDDW